MACRSNRPCPRATPRPGGDDGRSGCGHAGGADGVPRRHLKHLSHHLIGDTSHGDGRHNRNFRSLGIQRMLLHAQTLQFIHPHGGARIRASAPPDAAFERALALFDTAAAIASVESGAGVDWK